MTVNLNILRSSYIKKEMDTVYGNTCQSLTAVKMWAAVFKLVVTGLKKERSGNWEKCFDFEEDNFNNKLLKQL